MTRRNTIYCVLDQCLVVKLENEALGITCDTKSRTSMKHRIEDGEKKSGMASCDMGFTGYIGRSIGLFVVLRWYQLVCAIAIYMLVVEGGV